MEAAKQAALNHAGVAADAVRFAHARLEFDDGYWKYDVEFHQDNMKYDYDIDAPRAVHHGFIFIKFHSVNLTLEAEDLACSGIYITGVLHRERE